MMKLHNRRIIRLSALLLVALTGACGDGASKAPDEIAAATIEELPTLVLPAPAAVTRVQTSTQDSQSFVLTSPEEVARLLEVLGSLDDGWEVTTESNPPFVYASSLSGADSRPLVIVWTGEDWLGAYDMQGKVNVRQDFSGPERDLLLESLGVPPVVDTPSETPG